MLSFNHPKPTKGLDALSGHESLTRRAAKTEGGVAADPGLGVRPVLPGSARPRSFGPSLADVSWAAQPAN